MFYIFIFCWTVCLYEATTCHKHIVEPHYLEYKDTIENLHNIKYVHIFIFCRTVGLNEAIVCDEYIVEPHYLEYQD